VEQSTVGTRGGRRGRSSRATPVAAVSTVAIMALAVAAVVNSPGWPRVQQTFLNPAAAWDSLPAVLDGLLLNLLVLAAVTPVVLVIGLGLALVRTSRSPLWTFFRGLAHVYIALYRGMPILIILYIIGFGLPGLRLVGVPNDPLTLAIIALSLAYGAYVGEVLRGGIEAVDPSLGEAASLDGASRAQAMRLVVLPQAIRSQYPALINDFVALQKDCGMISVLGAIDAVRAARLESAEHFSFAPYVVAGLLFVALAVPTSWLADRLARRTA
jgi:polar amino acid transport system permease protein